jgi:hypothetical protein
VNRILSMNRFKPLHAEIVIVQPGLKRDAVTPDQSAVLAATYSFLNETINAAFDVVCSEQRDAELEAPGCRSPCRGLYWKALVHGAPASGPGRP